MKYPKVYHQMRAMLAVCEKAQSKVANPAYLLELAAELKDRIELIELENVTDDYTGEAEDLEGLDAA